MNLRAIVNFISEKIAFYFIFILALMGKAKKGDFIKCFHPSEEDIYICTESSLDGPLGHSEREKLPAGMMVVLGYCDQGFVPREDNNFIIKTWSEFFEKSQTNGASLIDRWVKWLPNTKEKIFALFSPPLHKEKDKGVSSADTIQDVHHFMQQISGHHPNMQWRRLQNRYTWHALHPIPLDARLRVLNDRHLAFLAATPKHTLNPSSASFLVQISNSKKQQGEVFQIIDRCDSLGDGLETRFRLLVGYFLSMSYLSFEER